jgi:C_GCAxxG_C_C family probable redox protein
MGVGEVCGAVTGGVLAIGLLYGQDKMTVSNKTKEFVRRFSELNGAVRCVDILGLDVNSPTGLSQFFDWGLKKTCNQLVSSSVQLLMEDWGGR